LATPGNPQARSVHDPGLPSGHDYYATDSYPYLQRCIKGKQ
jgi:hypothetical protein